MREIIAFTYWLNLFLVLTLAGVVFLNMRKRVHYYLFLNCIALVMCSISSLFMLFSETEDAYYLAFILSWTGKVGIVIALFFFCVKFSECKLPIIVTVIESGFALISYIIIVTTRNTGLFYSNLHLVEENGMRILEFEKCAWCSFWNATIVVVIMTCLFVLGKALLRDRALQKRKQYIAIIVALLIEIVIGFLTELPMGRYYDFNQLGFSICTIIFLFAIFRNNLMDTEKLAKEYVIDELSAGVIAMDVNGAVAYYNKKALQIFPEIDNEPREIIEQIEKSIQTGEPITVENRVYNFEERQLVHKLFGKSKMYVMLDATKQYQHLREMESQKKRADAANKAKSEFLANMSHEIRTPINAVLGMDEMILRESKDSTIREYAMDIQAAGQTLLTIINDILDLNKIESGKMEIIPVEYDVSKMIYDISNMIKLRANDKKLTFSVSIAADIPSRLYGDDVRIRQILTNLLTNAVKYTMKGTIWFRVGLVQKADGFDDTDVVLHFEVEDTGIGIKPEDMKKLFAEFERIEVERNRNIEGTGLGIPISMQLLHMMDSELKEESEYGKGSVFSFDLRQKVVEATQIGNYEDRVKEFAKMNDLPAETFVAPGTHVLVVDDNGMNRKVFKALLKGTQIEVTEAESGFRAIELASSQHFDMIFMDHMMPEMDGVESMKRIKSVKESPCINTPIIVLTANAIEGAAERYLEDGFDGYLSKPVGSQALLEIIKLKLIGESRSENTIGD